MNNNEKEWFIQAPWGRICLLAWGDCRDPPVLMVHGTLDTAASFGPLVSLLPQKFYYIAIELPGNGKSDRYPPGMMITYYDLMYSIVVVAKHFRWDKFIYIGHSSGCAIGKIYNITYPGQITKFIELDPIRPRADLGPFDFRSWYHRYFTSYYKEYDKYNSPKETAPKYKRDELVEMIMNNRGLTREKAEVTVDRMTEPAGDGLIRFTYDLRNKLVTSIPYTAQTMHKTYITMTKHSEILTILAESSVKAGIFDDMKFLFDESSFPDGNYKIRTVEGSHDFHFINPERVAPYITQFLLYGINGVESKAKL